MHRLANTYSSRLEPLSFAALRLRRPRNAMVKPKASASPSRHSPRASPSPRKVSLNPESTYSRRTKALLLSFSRATKTWNTSLVTAVLPVATKIVRLRNEIGSVQHGPKDDLIRNFGLQCHASAGSFSDKEIDHS
jgi:hypothetical protein